MEALLDRLKEMSELKQVKKVSNPVITKKMMERMEELENDIINSLEQTKVDYRQMKVVNDTVNVIQSMIDQNDVDKKKLSHDITLLISSIHESPTASVIKVFMSSMKSSYPMIGLTSHTHQETHADAAATAHVHTRTDGAHADEPQKQAGACVGEDRVNGNGNVDVDVDANTNDDDIIHPSGGTVVEKPKNKIIDNDSDSDSDTSREQPRPHNNADVVRKLSRKR